MYRKIILSLIFATIWYTKPVVAHEMTPTYPVFHPSYMAGVHKVTMSIFNKRKDVDWYEIGVFDKDRNRIPFVSQYSVMRLDYLDHLTFDVYVRDLDVERVAYICSRSKISAGDASPTLVASVICSKPRH